MNTLYLECASGISGDMTVASLLDLGADEQKLFEIIDAMAIECRLHTSRVLKNKISAYDFDVELLNEHCHDHGHEDHKHSFKCRKLNEINEIIERSLLSDNAKQTAKRMFEIVADAEAVVHNIPREEVCFHEVGAVDSIVDICSVAFCLDDLKIGRVLCSPLKEGHGYVKCQHGVLPVPVPATAEIAMKHKIPIQIMDNEGEMITPTGAAIVAAVVDEFVTSMDFNIKKIGIGAGKREFKNANILRAYLLDDRKSENHDRITLIETAIDDSTPEELSYCMELLFKAGVKDAFYAPIYMKKNRPAWQLSVMCEGAVEQDVLSIIFRQTTAVGVRRQTMDRVIMSRERIKADTKYGSVDANRFYYGDISKTALEYDAVKKLADEKNCSILELYRNR